MYINFPYNKIIFGTILNIFFQYVKNANFLKYYVANDRLAFSKTTMSDVSDKNIHTYISHISFKFYSAS